MRPHRGRRRRRKILSFIIKNKKKNDQISYFFPLQLQQLPYIKNFSKTCQNNSYFFSSSKKSYSYSFAHVIFGILLLVINISSCSCRGLKGESRPDFVCNNDDGNYFKCVCSRFNGNLDKEITECTQFLGVRRSPKKLL
jgi:hypothetical protein